MKNICDSCFVALYFVIEPRGGAKCTKNVPRKKKKIIKRKKGTKKSKQLLKNKKKKSKVNKTDTALLKSPEGTFRVHKVYGDGNCMFRAMSFILWETENNHKQLRSVVVEHIRENWNEYGPFVIAEWNISSRQEYFDYMIADGTFASELECTVLAKLYRMNLSIYREIGNGGVLKIIFHNRINRNYRTTARLLFSGHSDVGHYDVLILLSD